MKKDSNIYLQDILDAIVKIDLYVKQMSFDDFAINQMCQDAVIRNLQLIGEAANGLPKEFKNNNPSFPLKEAIDMRNFLVHDYSSIDLKVVWKTITDDVPPLKRHVTELLTNNR